MNMCWYRFTVIKNSIKKYKERLKNYRLQEDLQLPAVDQEGLRRVLLEI